MSNSIWVFACGQRRAGSTMQYHFARELVELAGGYNAGWVTWQKFNKTFYGLLDTDYPYVILKCHAFMPEHSKLAKELFASGRAKSIYIYRDMRDIAASILQMKAKYTWEYIVDTEIPSIIREHDLWTALDDIHISQYEKVVGRADETKYQSLIFEVGAIAGYLDIRVTKRDCERIAFAHTIDAHLNLLKDQEPGFDYEKLMWHNHIHDGIVGKYKTALTTEQIEQVEQVARDYLLKRGYLDERSVSHSQNGHIRDDSQNAGVNE